MVVTAKQANLLKQLNLPVPSSLQIASRLLTFALHGNGFIKLDSKERRVLIRKYWEEWVSKPVQIVRGGHCFQGQFGHIEYLKARTKAEISDLISTRKVANPLPFITAVRIDPATSKILTEIGLTSLKRVEVIQKRLFSP